jgi:signal peptidase II
LATKQFVLQNLDPNTSVPILGGLVTFRLLLNPGAAFSMGEGFSMGFALFAVAALAFVTLWLMPRVRQWGWVVVSALLWSGIAGNLTDRLFREPSPPLHGWVVDFIQIPYFAVFNVADICITAAAVIIVWLTAVRQVGFTGETLRKPDAESESEPTVEPEEVETLG